MKRISVSQLRVEPMMLLSQARMQKFAVCCGFLFVANFVSAAPAISLEPEAAQLPRIAKQVQGSEATAGNLQAWLQRVSQAAKDRNYSGVFVVQSGGRIVTSTIDHYVVHGHTLERVETLDGRRRILVCQNAKTQTILPDARLVVVEDHHTDFSFPRMLKMPQAHYADYYTLKQEGQERCAGFLCDVTRITPQDDLRYGYRLWTEQGSGLLVRAQTLNDQGKVLDQVAFTQLDLNPKPRPDLVSQALQGTAGYQVEHMRASLSTPQAQGWTMSKPVPGFESAGIYKRRLMLRGKPVEVTQWLFSDGLASVSLFAGPSSDAQHTGASLHMGDTNALFDRKGDWSVIVIGAVPAKTLQLFADSLTRIH
jgi:sigma-E factor negative regulatory protein RseB